MKENKKIMLYMMHWYPFEGARQPIYATVLRYLKQKGYSITILTSIPYFLNSREERWENYKGKFFIKEKWEDIEVLRSFVCSPLIFRHFKVFIRIINSISFSFTTFFASLFTKKQDIVLTLSYPPILIGITSLIISRIKRCQFVYCIEDIYPDILIDLNIIKNNWFHKILKKVERITYQKAKKVCVLSEQMKINLVNKGIPDEKIKVIPHFVDTDKIMPQSKDNPFSKEYNLEKIFIVLLPGSLSYRYNIDLIIKAAEILSDMDSIRFIFINRGELKDVFRKKVDNLGLNNVIFIPFQPEDRFIQVLASSDVCIVSLDNNFSSYSVPSKIYTIMSSARPIIAMVDEQSEIARIVKLSECGIVLSDSQPELLAEAIKTFMTNKEKCTIMGQKGREYVEKYYNKYDICKKYEEVLLNAITF